jgi:hypothetical protein
VANQGDTETNHLDASMPTNSSPSDAMPLPERAQGSPTKDFFISMITRDITLEDCVLDLLDNAVDGAKARNSRLTTPPLNAERDLDGFEASIFFSATHFTISDNCGGISLEQARNYAFHFGRRRNAPIGAPETVGLYGIGMKRAMFKIGRRIKVSSSTESDSFTVPIDVDAWAVDDSSWDFQLDAGAALTRVGTTIEITSLVPSIREEFEDSVFQNSLIAIIGRDYSLLLQRGFSVTVNNVRVQAFEFGWLQSDEFLPVRIAYEDEGVTVEIVAGLSRVPQDDENPGEASRSDTRYFGWFVVCNDRVILAGNKDNLTVWDDERFPAWHAQYNGFTGMVHFKAGSPNLLPWTTTKRGVEHTSPLYRRALTKMKELTRVFIDYTNQRKLNLEEARRSEEAATISTRVEFRPAMRLPVVQSTPRERYANIAYAVLESDYKLVATALGSSRMPRNQVGRRTFDFFKERMVEEEG